MSRSLKHCACVVALSALLVACVFLPLLPGRYDPLAMTLSAIAQALGVAGMLLLPLNAAWLIHEVRRRRARDERAAPVRDWGHGFALAALAAWVLIAAFVSFGAFAMSGPSLVAVVLALSFCGLSGLARRLESLKHVPERPLSLVPLYLLVVPVAVTGARFLFLAPAVDNSRNRAIRNSAELIAEIEAYHAERGHYPLSLAALHKDYDTGVIGIEQYEYEPRGDAYSVFFEQLAVPVGTREIVMYNKLGEHALPSHDSDILRWTPAQLAARPGHYAIHDATSPHWKYFWFD